MKNFTLLLWCVYYCTLSLSAAGSDELMQRNSLHNLHVNAFAHDKLGYMWIATAKGLVCYNGYEYTHYYHNTNDSTSISNDEINDILCDSQGRLWIATGEGLNMYDRNVGHFVRMRTQDDWTNVSFKMLFADNDNVYLCNNTYLYKQPKDGSAMTLCFTTDSIPIVNIIKDNKLIWIAASKDGISTVMALDEQFKPRFRPVTLESEEVSCSYINQDGVLWLGTSRGVRLINTSTGGLINELSGVVPLSTMMQFKSLSVTMIDKISPELMLIGTSNSGLYIYNLSTFQLKPCSRTDYFSKVNSQHILSFFKDNADNIWIGTFDKGYFLETTHKQRFNKDKVLQNYINDKFVSRITEDNSGNLLIATRNYGMVYYDRRNSTFREYNKTNSQFFGNANTNFVQDMHVDSKGRLWVGSENKLTVCRIAGDRLEPITSYPIKIVDIVEDSLGRIWVGTARSGVYIFDDINAKPYNLQFSPKSNNVTKIVAVDKNRMMCSLYGLGLFVVDMNNLGVSQVPFQDSSQKFAKSVINIYKDKEGLFWLGSYGRGLGCYNMKEGSLKTYSLSDGLPSNDVLGIVREGDYVWMSTSFGISRLSVEDDIFVNFYDYDGTTGNQFHEKSVYRDSKGVIYFGGNHGITFFDPTEIIVSHSSIPVVLENLKVFNENVAVGDSYGILKKSLAQTHSITLSHRQNVFSIDYAGIDFALSQKINYAYMLENFDKSWNYVNGYRRASYSNLPAGEYLFKVKAQNPDGTWDNENPTLLIIKVSFSPWNSPWAWVFYLLTVGFILFSFICLYIDNELSNERLTISEIEKKQEKELAQMKVDFFANISHELRTPLTLICGCANLLNNYKNNPQESSQLINLINYNVERLLRLLDQILDYSKAERDTPPMMVSNSDLVSVVNNVVGSYAYYAKEKNIDLEVSMPSLSIQIWADFEKLDKIINNLVSNALKYTEANGHIMVRVEIIDELPQEFEINVNSSRYLRVSVEDDGIGIRSEDMEHLFERYRRFDQGERGENKASGFGIGLNYVQRLVHTHKGKILAMANNPNGMIFSFVVPIDEQCYSQRERKEGACEQSGLWNELITPKSRIAPQTEPKTTANGQYCNILVVEDNVEVRMFISKLLGEEYNVVTATDGEQGLELIQQTMPDVIISDVIMPKINGFELCEHIKNNPEYCHIPIVLLTARATVKDRMEGYSVGADVYLEKPFYPELLKTIIRNLFENRERLKGLVLSKSNTDDVPAEVNLNPLDKKFIDRLYLYVEQEIANEELNVNFLGKEMGFSRTSFYRKITVLTGQSPNDFLRIYRLNRAAKLILEGHYTMSEVAEQTGFGTYSNFSTRFKKHFGVSPRKYQAHQTESNLANL